MPKPNIVRISAKGFPFTKDKPLSYSVRKREINKSTRGSEVECTTIKEGKTFFYEKRP